MDTFSLQNSLCTLITNWLIITPTKSDLHSWGVILLLKIYVRLRALCLASRVSRCADVKPDSAHGMKCRRKEISGTKLGELALIPSQWWNQFQFWVHLYPFWGESKTEPCCFYSTFKTSPWTAISMERARRELFIDVTVCGYVLKTSENTTVSRNMHFNEYIGIPKTGI